MSRQEITYRLLQAAELIKLQEIDRTEHIAEVYVYQNGKLTLKPEFCLATSFEPDELKKLVEKQHTILMQGGKVIGAFHENKLVGIASVEHEKRGRDANYCKMDILYVSSTYRGKGIGNYLVQECKKAAVIAGAEKLYISATPTKATVDFYLGVGAILTKEIDPVLFELEPLDIHLELQV